MSILAASSKVSLIVAIGPDGSIGRKGDLLIPMPADLKYFKKVTMGKPVVMGRKTYESIPKKFRPLEGRMNIVLTRDKEWQEAGVTTAREFSEVFKLTKSHPEIMVAGGGEIYKLALPFASKLYITQIYGLRSDPLRMYAALGHNNYTPGTTYSFLGRTKDDTLFPDLGISDNWKMVSSVPIPDENINAEWLVYEK